MATANGQEKITAVHGVGVVAAAVSLIRRHAGDRQPLPRLSPAARTRLVAHEWGPDLDGLEACLQRALILCDGEVIEPVHLALGPVGSRRSERRERAAILRSLRAERGRRRAAAERLGIASRTLRLKLADLRERGVPMPPVGEMPTQSLNHE